MSKNKKHPTSVLINYFLDGPCGDCPKALVCKEECIHLIAWDESKITVRELEASA